VVLGLVLLGRRRRPVHPVPRLLDPRVVVEACSVVDEPVVEPAGRADRAEVVLADAAGAEVDRKPVLVVTDPRRCEVSDYVARHLLDGGRSEVALAEDALLERLLVVVGEAAPLVLALALPDPELVLRVAVRADDADPHLPVETGGGEIGT